MLIAERLVNNIAIDYLNEKSSHIEKFSNFVSGQQSDQSSLYICNSIL
jgi:hypothetical protein